MSRSSAVVSMVAVALVAAVSAADWPQWRGPLGTGVSPETDVPIRWRPTANVAWKAPIAGVGCPARLCPASWSS